MTQTMPFLLEDAVKQKGAHFEHTKAWCARTCARNGMRACSASPERVRQRTPVAERRNSHVVRDGRLVTGQNPASAAKLAAVVLEALTDTQGERKASAGGGGGA